ncbi:MAG: oligosaccharide flippase family protein, partial [Candidatus Hermodarchaeota archaeon]
MQDHENSILSNVKSADTLKSLVILTAKNSGIIFTGKLFEYALRIPIVIILARLLMAEQYGQYTLTLAIVSLAASMAILGLNMGLIRYIPRYGSKLDRAKLSGTLKLGIGLPAILGVLISIVTFFTANQIAHRIFHEPKLIPLIKLASLAIPFLSLNNVLDAAIKGFSQMKYTAVAENFFQPVIRLSLIVVFAFLGLDATKAIAANNITVFLVTFILILFLNKIY